MFNCTSRRHCQYATSCWGAARWKWMYPYFLFSKNQKKRQESFNLQIVIQLQFFKDYSNIDWSHRAEFSWIYNWNPRTCLIWFRIFASGVFSLMRCHLIPSLNFTETLTASTRWMRSNEISSTDWLAPSTDQNKKKFCISFSISSKYQKRRRRYVGTDLPRLCIYCNIVPTRIYHVVASCFSSGYITCTRHLSDLIITNESTTSSTYFLANTNFLDS